jgi:hypothetical protein
VARRYGFIVVWHVPSLSFRRSTSLLTSHRDSAFGRSCTTSSNAREVNTITQRFEHWHTNGFGFYSGAGRIVGYTITVDTRNPSSSTERVWHRCLTCWIVEMECRSCEPGLDKQPQMSTSTRFYERGCQHKHLTTDRRRAQNLSWQPALFPLRRTVEPALRKFGPSSQRGVVFRN